MFLLLYYSYSQETGKFPGGLYRVYTAVMGAHSSKTPSVWVQEAALNKTNTKISWALGNLPNTRTLTVVEMDSKSKK